MRLEMVRRYATGKAPFLGVPVFSVAEGKWITAVFRREHLQAAASCPHVLKASYDETEHVLILNGGPRACYRLWNLRMTGNLQAWILRDSLVAWANGRRKSAHTRGMSAEDRRVQKLQEEIGKLERKVKKIYVHVPISPLLSRYKNVASESARESELRWRAEKPIRRALGQLVRRERKTWAKFYAEVEAISGHRVDSSRKHDRVCNRKGGPSQLEYLTRLYKHIGMSTQPYRSDWDPYKKQEWATDHGLDSFERHRKAQLEYLAAMNEKRNLQTQIDACREEIAVLQAATVSVA